MKSSPLALCAVLTLTLAGVAPAWAQSAETQARSYLEAGLARHAELGYARDRSVPDLAQPLRLDSAFLWPVDLRAGVNYRIYAACDNDCQDVDMEIYGQDGLIADRDIAVDDTPYVQITPERSGRAYVRLWVYQCNAEPCYVAARVVSGGTPAPREESVEEDVGGEYVATVRGELDDASASHIAAGYAAFGEDAIEPVMVASDGYRHVVRLDAGRSYLFQGACDQDCSDVDMEILDGRGEQVAEDVALDDRPVVRVRPQLGGDYTVRAWLAACSTEPCYVGVRSFSQGR